MSRKTIALVMAILLVLPTLFGGFTQPTSAKASISVAMAPEPDSIDPQLNQSVDGFTYVMHVFEGLTRVSKDKKTIPGIAYKWDVSKDLLTYTFHLRNAKWSDGKPVTAQDFEYAWKRALDPKTASTYAFQLYYIKGAEDYNTGKGKVEDVAVTAVDATTLKVVLRSPCAYFLDLLRTSVFMPVRKDIVEKYGEKWTQDPKSYIGDGAFVMSNWTHSSELVLTKSNTYWDKGSVLLKEIRFKLTDDNTACLNAFETGSLDYVDSLIPPAEISNLIAAKKLKTYTQVGTYYIWFNLKQKPFDDPRVRKALTLAIDRNYIVQKVTKAGQKPAVGLVPYDVPGAKKTFREEAPTYLKPTAQIAEAQKLLAQAGYPGGKGFPEGLEVFYNTGSTNKPIMEAVMQMWKQNLGITIKSPNMEWKVLQQRVTDKDYTITRMGWIGDYNDPLTFIDMYSTGNQQNKINYSDPKYDSLVKVAQNSGDQNVRMKAMRDAEKMVMDNSVVVPLYYYVFTMLENPKLKGQIVDPTGPVYFMYAYTTK